jgi:hypothetical protein
MKNEEYEARVQALGKKGEYAKWVDVSGKGMSMRFREQGGVEITREMELALIALERHPELRVCEGEKKPAG